MTRLLERIKRLEAATYRVDGIALCGDAYTIIKAWENNEPFESLSGVSVHSLREWGIPSAEAWDKARAASISDYEKTFGPGSYQENQDNRKKWRAELQAERGLDDDNDAA